MLRCKGAWFLVLGLCLPTACNEAKFDGKDSKAKKVAKPGAPAAVPSAPVASGGLATVGGRVSVVYDIDLPEAAPIAGTFSEHYRSIDLGLPPGVPTPFGCITAIPGQSESILVGGGANSPEGKLYKVAIRRDGLGHIAGFDGQAEEIAPAPYNDGGCVFLTPDLLLMSKWPVHQLALVSLATKSVVGSVALLNVGIPTAGQAANESSAAIAVIPGASPPGSRIKIMTWPSGRMFEAQVSIESGLVISNVVESGVLATVGPEGIAYVPPGSPGIVGTAAIVAEWSRGAIAVYQTDAQGVLNPESRQEVLQLKGAEGAYFDPISGDFLFSTFGNGAAERIVGLRGFARTPGESNFTVFDGSAFVDLDGNGTLSANDPSAVVNIAGLFQISGVPAGDWNVGLEVRSAHSISTPLSGSVPVSVVPSGVHAGIDFKVQPK